MPKRVTVKGKGADIFFGDYVTAPPPQEVTIAASTDSSHEEPPADISSVINEPSQVTLTELDDQGTPTDSPTPSAESSEVISKQAYELASMQESKHARKQARKSPLAVDVLEGIWRMVSERATVTNAFRYTDKELVQLSDVLHELGKRHGIRLTKQEVARLGLNALLWDYQTRGDGSMLNEFALRRKRQSQGGD